MPRRKLGKRPSMHLKGDSKDGESIKSRIATWFSNRREHQNNQDHDSRSTDPGIQSTQVAGKRKRNDGSPVAMGADTEETGRRAQANFRKAQEEFNQKCLDLLEGEALFAWYKKAMESASDNERRVNDIVWKIREDEREKKELFGNLPSEEMPGLDTREMGGQFLTNKERIDKSRLFDLITSMPKGCHLHLHLNAELQPQLLLNLAETQANMFIRSTMSLSKEGHDVRDEDGEIKEHIAFPDNFARTEMVFQVLPNGHDKETQIDVFMRNYDPKWKMARGNKENKKEPNPWMRWSTFRDKFKAIHAENKNLYCGDPDQWVLSKMVLNEEEVYGVKSTVNSIWARFNQATRCFKGLLNYERAYRWYIREACQNMINDRVMYAELRPMLLDKFIATDDGKGTISIEGQMSIVKQEVKKLQDELRARGELEKFPFGLKIIYCTPRSIPSKIMQTEIKDCIRLKKLFPELFCGFDLVGAEDRGNPTRDYRDDLLEMLDLCKEAGVEIPFMFHAGETLLDRGGSRDIGKSNLYDALILNAKRIGHGYSLVNHPQLLEKYREHDICIELCPISNELLGLCGCVKEHVYPQLLAAGIPCTVNADNPSLFSSSLSHEFYQVMVGDTAMNVHGWRQLVEWSITYSCLSDAEKEQAFGIFQKEWEKWCGWVITKYGDDYDRLDISL